MVPKEYTEPRLQKKELLGLAFETPQRLKKQTITLKV